MRRITRRAGVALALFASLALFAIGCGGDSKQAAPDTKKAQKVDRDHDAPGQQAQKGKGEETKHDGWWCDEHGIPEAECSLCSKKVAEACKAKGDWCEKHNRAKSQCFKCDPKLKEAFAARYRARYGKEPPPITDDD
jgi:hypothetical protein